jgi:cytoskeletal protein CcmA (bactofilin family)
MFSQSADQDASDQSPAPVGMRELPPQPAKPAMPAFPAAAITSDQPDDEAGPGPADSVIARDDHFEGTFTSRGTVRVEGSVSGRIEAIRVRIQEGARVEADVIVDEAIIAGEFTGNLTCRKRLEARPTGQISGHVETFKLMLHEGASVEGEMHMLPDPAAESSGTIRGTAPVRGEAKVSGEAKVRGAAPEPTASAPRLGTKSVSPTPTARAATKAAPITTNPAPGSAPRPEATATATAPRATSTTEALRVTPRAATPVTAGTNGSGSNGNPSRL